MDLAEEQCDSYQHQSIDEQPKDLTVKTAKKMKPIPPPLNLKRSDESVNFPTTLLKEFASFATSPKSPLMQKHLPFRKRVHMISAHVSSETDQDVQCLPGLVIQTLNEHDKNDGRIPLTSTNNQQETITTDSSKSSKASNKIIENNFDHHCDSTKVGVNTSKCLLQGNNYNISSTDKYTDNKKVTDLCGNKKNLSHQVERHESVLDLSVNQNSVLLSPAPSSLGSSREELTMDGSRISPLYQTRLWGLPWPPPIWHCFQSGTKLNLGSLWCNIEDMGVCPSDWPSELRVEQLSFGTGSSVLIGFSSPQLINGVLADVSKAHAFLIKDRGWTAVCGETLFSKYAVRCPSLQLHDIVMLPTIHRLSLPLPLPSPDICDRIKRFSFPPPDEPQPSLQLLSPPTTPTRKSQDCDKPKRPMNAFMLFAKRYRLELIQSHPGKDNRAISVILGEVWRTLPQEEREIYIRGARDLSEEQKLLHPDCWKRKRSHSTS